MTIQRMDHVGVVIDDLAAATAFFVELGFELLGESSAEGDALDSVVGLEGARSDVAMVQTPDGSVRLELITFHTPPRVEDGHPDAPSNARGLRHLAFVVDDIDATVAGLQARGTELVGGIERFGNSYRLCYVRGPEGIIVELAEKLG